MGVSAWLGFWLYDNILVNEHLAIRIVSSTSGMVIAYSVLLIVLGLIKKDELKRIPFIRIFFAA